MDGRHLDGAGPGQSLAARGGLAPDDLMRRFTAWYRDGAYSPRGRCFDIGEATRAALERFARTGDPVAGSTAPDSAGNGSIMRLAPVALLAYPDAEAAARLGREQSRTTHAAGECLESCDLLARILCAAIAGGGKAARRQDGWQGGDRLTAIAGGSYETRTRTDISSSGYVVATLEAALWCTARAESFEEALVLAVNLADDADTVGAVTGQVAGAVFGASAIPARWMAKLAWRERLEQAADRLIKARLTAD
nr:ADP-ribosylglycohydrolase family protein [Methylobacterium radiodurans]